MEGVQSDMATNMGMSIRSPYRAPTTHSEAFAHQPHSVCFRHPAIPSAQGNLLMILDGNDNAQGYLHHETARLACAIIAGNRWDGYLATSPTAPATDLPPHGLLTDEEYYFIVPYPTTPVMDSDSSASHQGASENPDPPQPTLPPGPYHYPVVPTFAEWVFPSGKLPGAWGTMAKRRPGVASTSDTTRSRDQSCRMTEAVEETDVAHIVPLAEEPWFTRNDMVRYGNKHASLRPGINDDANTMLLRADLHRSFDRRRFIFLPKKPGAIVTHVLESESLRDIYHNVQLNTTYIAPEYFFARFAWTILPLLKPFLARGQPRLLLIEGQPRWATSTECSDLADSPPKSRTASPTKKSRSRSKRTRADMEDELDSASHDSDYGPEPDYTHSYHRYAKRVRRGRSPTPRQYPVGTLAQLPPPRCPPTPPRSGESFLSPAPESVPCTLGDDPFGTEEGGINEAGVGESHDEYKTEHCPDAHPNPQTQTPVSLPQLRAMVSSHLRQERERSDPEERWEKDEAWLGSIVGKGRALDGTEIAR
ncbi:MAG: hypothetical protein Q9178_007999 [Gyalolechia marmorata]